MAYEERTFYCQVSPHCAHSSTRLLLSGVLYVSYHVHIDIAAGKTDKDQKMTARPVQILDLDPSTELVFKG